VIRDHKRRREGRKYEPQVQWAQGSRLRPEVVKLNSTNPMQTPHSDQDPESIVSSPAPSTETAPLTINRPMLVSLLALGLLGCFFLPWLRFLGVGISGFTLQKEGEQALLLWITPILCAITIFSVSTPKSQGVGARMTGLSAFGILGYAVVKYGAGVLQALEVGAWLGLALGLALIVVAPRKA
jgi:hypothetical protein